MSIVIFGLVGGAALGIVIALAIAKAAAARAAHRERSSLGEPVRFDADVAPGTIVVLDGVLVGPRNGRIFAWSGLPAEAPREAFALSVVGTELPIHGRISIALGSRETPEQRVADLAARFGATPAREDASSVRSLRMIASGDPVRIRAKCACAPDEGIDYRQSRARLVLEPFDERGIVHIASLRARTSVSASHIVAGAIFGGAIAAALLHLLWRQPPLPHPQPVIASHSAVEWGSAVPPPSPCNEEGDAAFYDGLFVQAASKYPHETALSARCSLRRAEADLAAHYFNNAAQAVRAYGRALDGYGIVQWREALDCIADFLASRDAETGNKALQRLGNSRERAMCRILYAEALPMEKRDTELGNLGFVWMDNQEMSFASRATIRMGSALLIESGATASEDEGKYSFYPDAFLAKNTPDGGFRFSGVSDMGSDVGTMEWETRQSLESVPFAIFAAMEKSGRPAATEPADFRMYVLGDLALFLAMSGDIAGAREVAAKLADVPDSRSKAPYWTTPSGREVRAIIDALEKGETPYRLSGEMAGALTRNLERGQKTATGLIRAAMLDRSIAVPLYFLETFARL